MSPEPSLARRALLLAPLALAACGFVPAYAPGGPGERLRGRVAVAAPETPDGFRLRAALEDRLGPAGPRAATLSVETEVLSNESGDLGGDPARERLEGRAAWRLVSVAGVTLAEGEEQAVAGATLAGPSVSVRAAQADARERLMVLLADRIVARLLTLAPEAQP